MSFQSLKVDELKKVAEFFLVEPEVTDAERGPTKKELLVALAAGDKPVSWNDYQETYLKSDVKKAEDRAAVEEETAPSTEDEERQSAAAEAAATPVEAAEDEPVENHILVKMTRKNGTYETHGLRFTRAHPFKSVPASVAESIISNEDGFVQALPSEVESYYN